MSRELQARLASLELLRQVHVDEAYANLAMPKIISQFRLDSRDAAFATELSMGTLRLQGFLDSVIEQASSRSMDRIDAPLRDVLRIGSYQLLFMRVATHAAVNTSVDLCKHIKLMSAKGFVNATLRRISEKSLSEWQSLSSRENTLDSLAIVHSHPRWTVVALRDALGDDKAELEELLRTNNDPPRMTGVSRIGSSGVETLLGRGGNLGTYSPYAVTVTGDVASWPEIQNGTCGLQDEGSQLVALIAAHFPLDGSDERWLDLCAGPGGKAALLKYLSGARGARLTANEVQTHRADLVESALSAVEGDHVVTARDGRDDAWRSGEWDRILVDAPCTGLGVLRRRAESRWRRTPADVSTLSKLQSELLENALYAIRPGGLVFYATCSPHLAETEFVVEDVMKNVAGARVKDARDGLRAVPGLMNLDSLRASQKSQYLRLWPHQHGTDGMFLAVLTRD